MRSEILLFASALLCIGGCSANDPGTDADAVVSQTGPVGSVTIPEQFRGTWALDVNRCENPELDPPTIITTQGLRREEVWGTPSRILSVSPDNTEMHLVMGYQYETVEAYPYDSRWKLSNSNSHLTIVEISQSADTDPEYREREYSFVRCLGPSEEPMEDDSRG